MMKIKITLEVFIEGSGGQLLTQLFCWQQFFIQRLIRLLSPKLHHDH